MDVYSYFVSENVLRFLKFGVVGFLGMVIDFSITYLCKEKMKLNKYFANAIGFVVSASSNYVFNRNWTFHSENSAILKEYLTFFLISTIGLAINTFIIWLLNDRLKINFYLSKLIAIAIVILWNFFANMLFTFNKYYMT